MNYDYAIIGMGAAGLNLAMTMMQEPWLAEKSVLIIDREDPKEPDKTWCYWELGEGIWDELLYYSWSKTKFISSDLTRARDLGKYKYKMLRSAELYKHCMAAIEKAPQFTVQKAEVTKVEAGRGKIVTGNGEYTARHIFDSRIAQDRRLERRSVKLLQHFEGWEIRTPEDVFDPEVFTMMDFRLKWAKDTSFTYVLPFDTKNALVEFTFFTRELIEKEGYEKMLKKYISDVLKIEEYEIVRKETGVIPMTSYPFHRHNSHRITKIGTAGGWVKASTGYSFRFAEKNSQKIVDNLKAHRSPDHGLRSRRGRFYDRLFLSVLYRQNRLGEELFDKMYGKNPIQRIFRFLDEESSFTDELRIIRSFPPFPFLMALFRRMLGFK